jgi:hypothetical protein
MSGWPARSRGPEERSRKRPGERQGGRIEAVDQYRGLAIVLMVIANHLADIAAGSRATGCCGRTAISFAGGSPCRSSPWGREAHSGHRNRRSAPPRQKGPLRVGEPGRPRCRHRSGLSRACQQEPCVGELRPRESRGERRSVHGVRLAVERLGVRPAFLSWWGANPLLLYIGHYLLLAVFVLPGIPWWHVEAPLLLAAAQAAFLLGVLTLCASPSDGRTVLRAARTTDEPRFVVVGDRDL